MRRVPSFLLSLSMLFVLCAGCRDGPANLTAPPEDSSDGIPPQTFFEITPSLLLVSQLPNDPFVQPMLMGVVGPVVANQLTASLGSIAVTPNQQTFSEAIQALTGVQREIQVARSQPETPALQTDGLDGSEELIIQDALGLIVDDALEQLLILSDSTGG